MVSELAISEAHHVGATEEPDSPLQGFPLATAAAYTNYFQQPEGIYHAGVW